MGKHNNVNFIQLNREIFNGKYSHVTHQAKWLYTVLTELEHRFTGTKEDFFFRSIRDLASDSGMSESSARRYKKELEKSGLIQTWLMHWINTETGQKSEKHITAFRILR